MNQVDLYIANFCKNVRMTRLNLNMTQEKLAEKIGVSPNQISRIERGYMPSFKTFLELVVALDTTADSLLYDDSFEEGYFAKNIQIKQLMNMMILEMNKTADVIDKIDEIYNYIKMN